MTISILGCGWLGFPLAVTLLESNHTVKGSTTTETKISKLEEKGIEPYLIKLDPELQCEDCQSFWDSDALILNIPSRREDVNIIDYHTQQIKSIVDRIKLSSIKHVIFVSSTSVYPKLSGVVEENDAIDGKAGRDSGNALLHVESMLNNQDEFDTTVVRFGGLYGYDRHPVRYMAGKKNLTRAKAPVNLIHRDDCIRIIQKIVEKEIKSEVFNAVSDGHPPRKMYYTTAANTMDLEPPTFAKDKERNYKVVSNTKLKKTLKYRFIHPNPLDIG